jgi:hypothetical protein
MSSTKDDSSTMDSSSSQPSNLEMKQELKSTKFGEEEQQFANKEAATSSQQQGKHDTINVTLQNSSSHTVQVEGKLIQVGETKVIAAVPSNDQYKVCVLDEHGLNELFTKEIRVQTKPKNLVLLDAVGGSLTIRKRKKNGLPKDGDVNTEEEGDFVEEEHDVPLDDAFKGRPVVGVTSSGVEQSSETEAQPLRGESVLAKGVDLPSSWSSQPTSSEYKQTSDFIPQGEREDLEPKSAEEEEFASKVGEFRNQEPSDIPQVTSQVGDIDIPVIPGVVHPIPVSAVDSIMSISASAASAPQTEVIPFTTSSIIAESADQFYEIGKDIGQAVANIASSVLGISPVTAPSAVTESSATTHDEPRTPIPAATELFPLPSTAILTETADHFYDIGQDIGDSVVTTGRRASDLLSGVSSSFEEGETPSHEAH